MPATNAPQEFVNGGANESTVTQINFGPIDANKDPLQLELASDPFYDEDAMLTTITGFRSLTSMVKGAIYKETPFRGKTFQNNGAASVNLANLGTSLTANPLGACQGHFRVSVIQKVEVCDILRQQLNMCIENKTRLNIGDDVVYKSPVEEVIYLYHQQATDAASANIDTYLTTCDIPANHQAFKNKHGQLQANCNIRTSFNNFLTRLNAGYWRNATSGNVNGNIGQRGSGGLNHPLVLSRPNTTRLNVVSVVEVLRSTINTKFENCVLSGGNDQTECGDVKRMFADYRTDLYSAGGIGVFKE
eukprot:CAMPEP_0114984834 /NCGR_PEP_ID=MMETSP0216-20121206/7507_1 /TAXON_ID=223996 /ORGANISM="Protocruzia adherens, Strain Boccale" /LENGTH=302 /DNA_ID=CAMNT_0002347035 /DNA_START=395 /DNA_END=1303 /DNA_ORIENTATION=+